MTAWIVRVIDQSVAIIVDAVCETRFDLAGNIRQVAGVQRELGGYVGVVVELWKQLAQR